MANVLLVGSFRRGDPGAGALCAAFGRALAGNKVTIASTEPDVSAPHGSAVSIAASARAMARASRRADVVVVGGGTVFKRLHPANDRHANDLLRSLASLVANARLRGSPVAMIGVGAGTILGKEATALARWLVRHTDLLVLRDEESAAVLTDSGIPMPFRVGADPAWVLLEEPPAIRPRSNSITVVVSHLGGISPASLAAGLAPLTGRFEVRVQPWEGGARSADAGLAADVRHRLDDQATVVDAPADLGAARAGFAKDRLVIASRFHAMVAAGAAGTPVLALTHEPLRTGLAALARRLHQPAVPAHATGEVLVHAIADALRLPAVPAAAVRAEMAGAEEAFVLLRRLVTRGDIAEPSEIGGLRLSDGAGSW